MTEWQPIETAPKDGSELLLAYILMHDDLPHQLVVGRWDDEFVEFREPLRYEQPLETQPTHWMPLPEPPK